MAVTVNPVRERVNLVGIESTFAVTPSGTFPNAMQNIVCMHDNVGVDKSQQEMLDVLTESVRRDGVVQPVHGLTTGSKVDFGWYIAAVPAASQITSTTIPTLSHRLPYLAHFGAEAVSTGTTTSGDVAAGGSTITGQSGWGATLTNGGMILLVTAYGAEPRKVVSVSTDTATIAGGQIGASSSGAMVRGLFTNTQANSAQQTFAFQRAFVGDTAQQWTFDGCSATIKWNFPRGKLATATLEGAATLVTGPSAQSISTAPVVNDMGPPFLVTSAKLFITSGPMTDTSVTTAWETIEVEDANTWEMIPDGNQPQAINGMINVGGRPRAAKITVMALFDHVWDAAFLADTAYNIEFWLTEGSGNTASVAGFQCANATLVERPSMGKSGEQSRVKLVFHVREDTTITAGGAAPTAGTTADFANSVLTWFYG